MQNDNFNEKKIEELNIEIESLKTEKQLIKSKYLMYIVFIIFVVTLMMSLILYIDYRNAKRINTIYIDDETFLGNPNHAYRFDKKDQLSMNNEMHRRMIQKELQAYVESFYFYTENKLEEEATKRVYMMSSEKAYEEYKKAYTKYKTKLYPKVKDKFWPTCKVIDFNFVDAETAQIRIQLVLLKRHPDQEGDRVVLDDRSNLVEVKFKQGDFLRNDRERYYNPLDLVVTDFKALD